MIAAVVDVTSRQFNDGHPGFIAWCDGFPDLLGHGDDHDEAVADLVEQIENRTIH